VPADTDLHKTSSSSLSGRKNDIAPFAGLKVAALTPLETLAQSMACVAPSSVPALAVGLTYATCGNAAWLAYLLATITILLTGLNIIVFARRSATPGSLYTQANLGCGRFVGMLAGWALLGGYVLSVGICSVQFSIFASETAQWISGRQLSPMIFFLFCSGLAAFMAYKNIKLSAELMLWCEIVSMSIIAVLCGMALFFHGNPIDTAQLTLKGVTPENFRLGFVLVFFYFAGFEGATVLGIEGKSPLRNIPMALIGTALSAGTFYVFSSYAMVHGFSGSLELLKNCATPLSPLSQLLGVPFLGHLTSLAVAISFFACTLGCLNAAARILFTMGHDKFFPLAVTRTHKSNKTPHVAILASLVAGLIPALVLLLFKQPLLDIVAWTATVATYGWIFAYVVVSIGAPLYLRTLKQLTIPSVLVAIASTLCLTVTFVSTLYPMPAAPYCWLPYVFLTYLAVGILVYRYTNLRNTKSKVRNL